MISNRITLADCLERRNHDNLQRVYPCVMHSAALEMLEDLVASIMTVRKTVQPVSVLAFLLN